MAHGLPCMKTMVSFRFWSKVPVKILDQVLQQVSGQKVGFVSVWEQGPGQKVGFVGALEQGPSQKAGFVEVLEQGPGQKPIFP